MKKYILTDETMEYEGHILHRILYVRDFNLVKKNQLGGWIESESNLSHEGDCRVMNDAKVFGNAQVMENASMYDDAVLKDNAQIRGISMLVSEAVVGADTIIGGRAFVMKSTIFFYEDISMMKEKDSGEMKENIGGGSHIGRCNIEGTGFIKDKIFRNRDFYGFLDY